MNEKLELPQIKYCIIYMTVLELLAFLIIIFHLSLPFVPKQQGFVTWHQNDVTKTSSWRWSEVKLRPFDVQVTNILVALVREAGRGGKREGQGREGGKGSHHARLQARLQQGSVEIGQSGSECERDSDTSLQWLQPGSTLVRQRWRESRLDTLRGAMRCQWRRW